MQATAKKLFAKLFVVNEDSCSMEDLDSSSDEAENSLMAAREITSELSLHQKLDVAISNVTRVENAEGLLYDVKNITKEMNIYEATGKRTNNFI